MDKNPHFKYDLIGLVGFFFLLSGILGFVRVFYSLNVYYWLGTLVWVAIGADMLWWARKKKDKINTPNKANV